MFSIFEVIVFDLMGFNYRLPSNNAPFLCENYNNRPRLLFEEIR